MAPNWMVALKMKKMNLRMILIQKVMKTSSAFRLKKVILDPKYHIIITYFLSLLSYLHVIYL